MGLVIDLACPSCGGSLKITDDIERFACGHCGKQCLVRREGGAVSLHLLAARIEKASAALDDVDRSLSQHNLELALKRQIDEMDVLSKRVTELRRDLYRYDSGQNSREEAAFIGCGGLVGLAFLISLVVAVEGTYGAFIITVISAFGLGGIYKLSREGRAKHELGVEPLRTELKSARESLKQKEAERERILLAMQNVTPSLRR